MREGEYRTNPSISNAQRVGLEIDWVNSLHELSGVLSGEPKRKIDETIKFWDDHVYPGFPIVNDTGEYWGISHDGDERSIGLLALFACDSQLHPGFKKLVDEPVFHYNEVVRSVVIPPVQLSKCWMGIKMFHELRHAKYDYEGEFCGVKDSYYIEEQSVHRDEHEIIRAIYGDSYASAVDYEARILSGYMDGKAGPFSKQLEISTDVVLYTAMDESEHAYEDLVRRSAVKLDLGYTALDLIGKNEPHNYAVFTKTLLSRRDIGLMAG